MTLKQRACFTCRKCFKKSQPYGEPVKCPQCAGPLFTMGTAFRAPKQTDVAEWLKVEQLIHSGFLFRRHGGPPPPPQAAKPRATAHGRVRQTEIEGKTQFTLLKQPLQSWCMVEVRLDNEWVRGVFKSRATPHIKTDSGKIVLLEPNTVCRWPKR